MHRLNHLVELAQRISCKIDIIVGRDEYNRTLQGIWPWSTLYVGDWMYAKVVGLAFSDKRTALVGVLDAAIDKNSNLVYYGGLHELGHLACDHRDSQNLEHEAQAWDWAFRHTLEPMECDTEQTFRTDWFGSYVNAEDDLGHTAGPMYQMFKNQYGFAPKPKFITKFDDELFKLRDWKIEWIPKTSK